jgi:hypothetical protein
MRDAHPENFPGILRLQQPYRAWIMLLDDKSPACYINDAKGTGKEANVEFQQADASTNFGPGEAPWYTFMNVAALRDITAGEELLVTSNIYIYSVMKHIQYLHN